MPSLHSPLSSLKGIGPANAKKFHQLDLVTLEDALWHLPVRHEDWRNITTISAISAGMDVTLLVTIDAILSRRAWRRRMTITEARVSDTSQGGLTIVWFNLPYLAKTLKAEDRIYVSGTVTTKNERLQLVNPAFERPSADPTHATLVPVYRSVDGLSQRQIRTVMKAAVALVDLVPDPLPKSIRDEHGLVELGVALHDIHFSATPAHVASALRRLKFDELLRWQLELQSAGTDWRRVDGRAIPFPETEVRRFVQSLPFELTDDQRLCAWQIFQDLAKPEPMARLLQGEVGSGKTVVGALAAFSVVRNHDQVAWLAPTVVLAAQHFTTLSALFAAEEITIACLTGASIKVNTAVGTLSRTEFTAAVASGEISLVVGTHALLNESIEWASLGLVVVDEQQRFGVQHRQTLLERQRLGGQPVPHYLSLTATPIPRTMALWLSGQLEVSRLTHRPVGRTKIVNRVLGPDQRSELRPLIEETTRKNERVFVITPTIVESDALGVRSATSEHERLRKEWPRLRIGLLHGSLAPAERVRVLEHFRDGSFDLLVATTVVEVGIDIPEATLMIIEGAERFGLAQLHQLRGRTGRSERPSTCVFVTDRTDPATLDRLRFVATSTDGLALAERDLTERGGGELYGLRQSGLPDWRLASLNDTDLLPLARNVAQRFIATGTTPAALINAKITPRLHRE